jgi:hypothetical protein
MPSDIPAPAKLSHAHWVAAASWATARDILHDNESGMVTENDIIDTAFYISRMPQHDAGSSPPIPYLTMELAKEYLKRVATLEGAALIWQGEDDVFSAPQTIKPKPKTRPGSDIRAQMRQDREALVKITENLRRVEEVSEQMDLLIDSTIDAHPREDETQQIVVGVAHFMEEWPANWPSPTEQDIILSFAPPIGQNTAMMTRAFLTQARGQLQERNLPSENFTPHFHYYGRHRLLENRVLITSDPISARALYWTCRWGSWASNFHTSGTTVRLANHWFLSEHSALGSSKPPTYEITRKDLHLMHRKGASKGDGRLLLVGQRRATGAAHREAVALALRTASSSGTASIGSPTGGICLPQQSAASSSDLFIADTVAEPEPQLQHGEGEAELPREQDLLDAPVPRSNSRAHRQAARRIAQRDRSQPQLEDDEAELSWEQEPSDTSADRPGSSGDLGPLLTSQAQLQLTTHAQLQEEEYQRACQRRLIRDVKANVRNILLTKTARVVLDQELQRDHLWEPLERAQDWPPPLPYDIILSFEPPMGQNTTSMARSFLSLAFCRLKDRGFPVEIFTPHFQYLGRHMLLANQVLVTSDWCSARNLYLVFREFTWATKDYSSGTLVKLFSPLFLEELRYQAVRELSDSPQEITPKTST